MLCASCPRECGAQRDEYTGGGACKSGTLPVVARAALHMWEEPCISGERGSGTVFFSGCALRCVYCQNREISLNGRGKVITTERLADVYRELIELGAHNINLVNPTHFADAVITSLRAPLPVPVVYNTGGYERVETLQRFDGKLQIYMPDMKYALSAPAARYSNAPDYFEVAKSAISEMFRQTGRYELGGDGLLRRGVIIRHLILPGNIENTRRVIDWVSAAFRPGDVLFSLMSQYTPCGDLSAYPELERYVSDVEYDDVMRYLRGSAIETGYFQEPPSGEEAYIPDFDFL
jgi:putative pyruvate formate lyase activating enzyme